MNKEWKAHGNGIHQGTRCIATTDGEDRHANAHLIAAAPDLLAALEAYQAANRIHSDREAHLYDQAKAAIKKAKGE